VPEPQRPPFWALASSPRFCGWALSPGRLSGWCSDCNRPVNPSWAGIEDEPCKREELFRVDPLNID
jgi:hypothetical protein